MNPVNGSQVDLQSLKRSITDRVRCELDNLGGTDETRVYDVDFTAMDSLVTLKVELVIRNQLRRPLDRIRVLLY